MLGDLSPGTIPSTFWEAPKGKPALPASHWGSAVDWFLCRGVSCRLRSPGLISPPSTDCKTCSRDFRPHPWQQLPPPAPPGSWEQTRANPSAFLSLSHLKGKRMERRLQTCLPQEREPGMWSPGKAPRPNIPNWQRYLRPDCYQHRPRTGGLLTLKPTGFIHLCSWWNNQSPRDSDARAPGVWALPSPWGKP